MRRFLTPLLAMLLLVIAVPARASVPQTIIVDGVNDFDPANLLKDDTGDTQPGCVPVVLPLDLGRVYVTNDATYLYVGIEFARTCFNSPMMNLGMAFDNGTATGGITDPWGRKIGWANVPFKPDFAMYDKTPNDLDVNGWQAFYKDTLGAWAPRGAGSHALGIADGLTFKELKLPLAQLGVTAGTQMHLEFWTTQDSPTKGPLDALASDDVQMSHPNKTTYDTTAVVQMTHMLAYTVLNYVDAQPPVVSSAVATGFTVLANRQVQLFSNKIDLAFNEPVDLTTSQVAGNYTYSGPSVRSVISALRDGASPNIVHLTLNAAVAANAAAHVITVTGVNDAALTPNTIVANGTTNVGAFFIQNVTFNGDFHLGLCNGNFTVADTFAVEGSLSPLTFSLCDNVLLTDANADGIYNATVPFTLPRDPATLKGTADLGWKFSQKCVNYEPLALNRSYALSSDNGAAVSINEVWNNDNPANFTTLPVDVIFQVNASALTIAPSDVISLLGNTSPLHFTQPSLTPMFDDGTHGDLLAGDKIYTARVTFPTCSPKSVDWKVDLTGSIECSGGGQGNRNVVLNDLLYSSANPITVPARGFNRCTVIDKPLTVVFKVNMGPVSPLPSIADTVIIRGNTLPLGWGWPGPTGPLMADAVMADDGLGADTRAHDGVFTRSVTFPDSSLNPVEFKYGYKWLGALGDSTECLGYPNRTMTLDDVTMSSGTPIVRLWNVYNYCADPTAVDPGSLAPRIGAAFGVLRSVMPNPVARRASF
jgi:hypothetical protein